MKCPNCNSIINENQTVCTHCNKVLLLECPNCHSLGESPVCEKCGYTILTKCSKCNKIVPTKKEKCKCGFPTSTSLAYQECESDEFASIIIDFGSLKKIKKQLKSVELYTKFFFKLKNLLYAQIKGVDCKLINYDNTFVINLNKELSFPTSSDKAVRLALKIVNAFTNLNLNIIEELSTPLNLSLTIIKKDSENLQTFTRYKSNVKPLNIKKDSQKHLKGLQIILDQYVRDIVNKKYKTDSLYSLEENGETLMFYEIILNSYVLPPSKKSEEDYIKIQHQTINKKNDSKNKEDGIYSFKVFDINAKCSFERCSTVDFHEKLTTLNSTKDTKILSIRTSEDFQILTTDIIDFYRKNDYRVITASCTEQLSYKPWGLFELIFRDYFNLPYHNKFIDSSKIDPAVITTFKPIFDFLNNKPTKAMTHEDARYFYMEIWNKFLAKLDKTLILINGFEYLDDTSIQTLDLYFDKFKKIKPNFIFVTSKDLSVHSKFKNLLRTNLYTELILQESSIDSCLTTIKSDATDFIQSFYYEKIKENFQGSYLYFTNALEYLKETGVLVDFENKLLIKNKKSVIIPQTLRALLKTRMKFLSKNQDLSLILAYSSILGARIDLKTLESLGIKNINETAISLAQSKLVDLNNDILTINNFNLIEPIIKASLKKEAEAYLAKNILAQLGKGLNDTDSAILMGRLGTFKEEYLTLWKNAQFAIKTGDYDAYLKNCLGFLSLIEHINTNISPEEIENNKKDVFNNILMTLYSYSPTKIYNIENLLLMDAINKGDDDKIVKLSNLMLQGALATSNYSEALGLLHNILSRLPNPILIVENNINTKFLLLSLVKIEILYNIGNFNQCVEIAEDILAILSPDVIEKIKPASFSTNLFVSHILETFRLVAFAKLFLLDENLEDFFTTVKEKLDTEIQEQDCIIAIKDFLSGKVYEMGNIEEYSAFSKVIFLILQEFSILNNDYKRFAQNIYQAKLLASDIHQHEIELFCDLMIAYAYSKIGLSLKAESIYKDVLEKVEKSAMFNILVLVNYLLAKLKLANSLSKEALLIINNMLSLIHKYNNQSKIMYAIFEKLYIDTAIELKLPGIDIESEALKLSDLKNNIPILISE